MQTNNEGQVLTPEQKRRQVTDGAVSAIESFAKRHEIPAEYIYLAMMERSSRDLSPDRLKNHPDFNKKMDELYEGTIAIHIRALAELGDNQGHVERNYTQAITMSKLLESLMSKIVKPFMNEFKRTR